MSKAKLWLYGTHAVNAALVNPRRTLYGLTATHEALKRMPMPTNVPVTYAQNRDFERWLPPGAVHQGLALSCAPLDSPSLESVLDRQGERALFLVLDRIYDPRNLGAVVRSAAAFSEAFSDLSVILPHRHAPPESGVLAKSACGALEQVPLVRVSNVAQTLRLLKRHGVWCIAFAPEAPAPFRHKDVQKRTALVFGSEGQGLRSLVRRLCHEERSLSSAGMSSLNVSVSVAIALYESAVDP